MKNSSGKRFSEILITIGLLIFSALIFLLVLTPREIPLLKTASVLARYNTTRFVLAAGLLLFAGLMIKNESLSSFAAAGVIFASVALSLNGLWAGAYSENYVLAGLIPRSDAYGFYTGIITFLEKGYLDGLAARRPLFGILFGLFLNLSRGNLQIALGIYAYLIALSLFAMVSEARKVIHPLAATLLFLIAFLFIRRFTGITMSEQIGFLLGTAALTAFLSAVRMNSKDNKASQYTFLLGVCLFALSQATRPGSMALLPLLPALGGWLWNSGRRLNWRMAGIVVLIIAAVFGFNNLVFRNLAAEDTIQTGNFGYGVYGLAVGGKGWDQIFSDHPVVNTLPHGEREARILQIIIETLKDNPGDYVRGMLKQFGVLFSFQPTNSFFSYMWSANQFFSYALVGASFALCLTGIFYLLKQSFSNLKLLIITILVGFLASLTVAPAYQTQYMRVYAASIAPLALLPAFGLHQLTILFKEKLFPDKQPGSTQTKNGSLSVWTSAFIAVFILCAPVLAGMAASNSTYSAEGCPEGQDEAVLRYNPSASIFIHRNSPDIYTWVPHITQLDYKGSIHNICCADEIDYFKHIPAPNVIFGTVNLLDDNAIYLIAEAELLPEESAYLRICGRIENVRRERSDSGFLYPARIKILDSE